ncbi:hypothetical protein HOLleu_04593 [Holothuria leucospilota]|uniref:Uncharacterized protein n=1 Tax=Holothuria leucospilota TaxID=206669 RepID=A0A9Q1CS93_HOLLE|nr:hypothetical protein HOLleu_04593 [Holothuria leucospilota]
MDSEDCCHSVEDNDDNEDYCSSRFVTKMLLVAQACHQLVEDPLFEEQGIRAVEDAAATLKLGRKRANIAKLGGAVAGIAGNVTVIAWKMSSESVNLLSFGIALVVVGVIVTITSDFSFQLYKWNVVQNVKEIVENFIEACLFLEAEERFYTTLLQKQQGRGICYENDGKLKVEQTFEFRKSLKDMQKCADDLKMNQHDYQVLGRFLVSLCDFVKQTYSTYGEVGYHSQESEETSQNILTMLNALKREKDIILNIFIVMNEMGVALTLTVLSSTDYIQGDPETNQVISSLERNYMKAALRRKAWNFFWRFMNVFNLLVNVATLVAVTFNLARNSPDEVAELFLKISTGMSHLVKTDREKREALNSSLFVF